MGKFLKYVAAVVLLFIGLGAVAQDKTAAYYNVHASEILPDAQAAFRDGQYNWAVELCRLHYAIVGDTRADALREKAEQCARLAIEMNTLSSYGAMDAAREKAQAILELNPDDKKAQELLNEEEYVLMIYNPTDRIESLDEDYKRERVQLKKMDSFIKKNMNGNSGDRIESVKVSVYVSKQTGTPAEQDMMQSKIAYLLLDCFYACGLKRDQISIGKPSANYVFAGGDRCQVLCTFFRSKNGNSLDYESLTDYVDLGLPSGTLWKIRNEEDLYSYDEAVKLFGTRLPSKDQWEELRTKCKWEGDFLSRTTVTGPNGKSIDLHMTIPVDEDGLSPRIAYSGGMYWSSTTYGPIEAWYLEYESSEHSLEHGSRSEKMPVLLVQDVRDIRSPKPVPSRQELNLTQGVITGHEWVDLGLSVKWATCNVGASSPEEYGDYFAWGETRPKSDYSWSTLKYCLDSSGDSFSKYNTRSDYGSVDSKTRLELGDDAARANWGGSWRMPTRAEQDELRTQCTWIWTTQGGKNGYKVTGKNGNSVFLPAAGYRYGKSLDNAGSYGSFWSSSLDSDDPNDAYGLNFDSGGVDWFSYYRDTGFPVRPVSE